MNFRQISCERNITGNNFTNGEILFKWDMPSNLQINLSKSYFLIKATIKTGAGSIAPTSGFTVNYLAPHCLFRQMCYCINGQTASEISYNYPQIAALKHRLMHKQTWKKNTLRDLEMAEPSYYARLCLLLRTLGGDARQLCYQSPRLYLSAAATIEHNSGGAGATADNVIVDAGDWRGLTANGSFILRHKPTRSDFLATSAGAGTILNVLRLDPNQAAIAASSVDQWTIITLGGDNIPQEANDIYDMILKPKLGIFDADTWLGSHKMEMIMHSYPAGSLEKVFYQSVVENKIAGVGVGDLSFSVNEFVFFACVRPASMDAGTTTLVYDDIRLHLTSLATNDTIDSQFTVEPKSSHFTIAIQDQDVEGNSLWSSTKFKARNNRDLQLTKYYINYRDTIQPNPYPVVSGNLYKQQYYENMIYSSIEMHRDIETLAEWLDTGMFLHHRFSHARDTGNGKVTVVTQFSTDFAGDRPNLLLFEHIPCRISLSTSGNKIIGMTKTW